MSTSIAITKKLSIRLKTGQAIVDVIAYLFIFLFLYTAFSKFSDLAAFESALSAAPHMEQLASILAPAIPAAEAIIALLLIVPASRITGLSLSLGLMLLFTTYLIYMLLTASQLPCHCGGVISSLSWTEHIFFNAGFIILAAAALLLYKQINNYSLTFKNAKS